MDPRALKPETFRSLNSPEERLKFLLRYAILAPSTHNTQPWLFKILGNKCDIYYNEKYILTEADPKRRDLYISMGCMLENLTIAAKAFGVFGNLEIKIDESKRYIATFSLSEEVELVNDSHLENLLQTIPKRVNARGIFTRIPNDLSIIENVRRDLPSEYTEKISVNYITNKDKIEEIAALTAQGLEMAYKSTSFRKEMSKWMKNSLTLQKEGIPGYALRMPFLLSFILPTIVRHKDIGAKLGSLNKKSLASATAVTIINSQESNANIWLTVGRIAERMMLDINGRGLNTSIFVAAVEMGNLSHRLMEISGIKKEPQFLFIIGKMQGKLKPTPRHPLENKLI